MIHYQCRLAFLADRQEARRRNRGPAISSTSPSITFNIFPRLPLELQDLVWDHTLPRARVHLIDLPDEPEDPWLQIVSPTLPVAFHVCQRSRAVAQRRTKPINISTNPTISQGRQALTYTHPTDILHINRLSDASRWRLGPHPFNNISIQISPYSPPPFMFENTDRVVFEFPSIEKIFQFAKEPPNLFLVLPANVPGFERHRMCRKRLPVGEPFDRRPHKAHVLNWLTYYPDFVGKITKWSPKVSHMLQEGEATLTTMPVACGCRHVKDDLTAVVENEAARQREAERRRATVERQSMDKRKPSVRRKRKLVADMDKEKPERKRRREEDGHEKRMTTWSVRGV